MEFKASVSMIFSDYRCDRYQYVIMAKKPKIKFDVVMKGYGSARLRDLADMLKNRLRAPTETAPN